MTDPRIAALAAGKRLLDICPDCHHRWRAHQGRNGAERCWYNNFTKSGCPCRRKNPDVEAEEQLAGALWRMTTRGD